MRIGIDGTPLAIPYHCGQRRYLENLVFNLAKIDKKNEYFIFTARKVPVPNQKNFRLVIIPNKILILKRQLIMPIIARSQNLDLFHYPDVWGSVFFRFPKTIVTLHDRAPSSSYPKWYKSPKYALMRKLNEFTRTSILRTASAIIVPSKFVKHDVSAITYPNIPLVAVYQGVADIFRRVKSITKRDFFLAMADFSPRKNIYRVMEAYSLLIKKTKKNIGLKIVISNSDPKPGIQKKARDLGILRGIKILQNVPTTKLVGLYNQSLCFIYPSLYEGFGLPILEAMACGTPVITSNYGAMKEVGDSAAYLVNPRSTPTLRVAMEKMTQDEKLRELLIKRGLKRARLFSWKKTALKTLGVYQSVYRNG